MNPTRLNKPAFLINTPLAFENSKYLKSHGVDFQQLTNQFFDVYNYISTEALVYLIPNITNSYLISLATANIGCILESEKEKDIVLLNTKNRVLGEKFFKALNYQVKKYDNFSGELNLRYLKGNIYIGGYSTKEELKNFKLIENEFDIQIIKINLQTSIKENFPYLNNILSPITKDHILLNVNLIGSKEIKQLEKYCEIIEISSSLCTQGVCNNLRYYNSLLGATNIYDLKQGTKEHYNELKKNRFLEDLSNDFGMELVQFNLSEYLKLGFWLTDLILHLNSNSFNINAF